MKKGIYVLPNTITLCGLFAGFYSIVASIKGMHVPAAWAIVVAGVCDGMDGWVARLTNSTSKFGIELDSLADSTAFGTAPAVLMYVWALSPFGRIGWAAAFLFAACGVLRLARYNVQMVSTEKKYFTGMPIPAAAGIVASTIIFFNEMAWEPGKNPLFVIMMYSLAVLMVSTLKFHGLKEIDFGRRRPFWILVGVVIVFVVFTATPEVALFGFAMIYLFSGIIENTLSAFKRLGGRARKKNQGT